MCVYFFVSTMISVTCMLCRNDLIDGRHKTKEVPTEREVNPKQIVPRMKEEKEQVIDTCTLITGQSFSLST